MQVAQEVQVQSIARIEEQLEKELVLLAGHVEVDARHLVLLECLVDEAEDQLPVGKRLDAPIKGLEASRQPLKTFGEAGLFF